MFHSYLAEKHFFHWLEEIVTVKNVAGGKRGLTLEIEAPIDDALLRGLIAVLTRYDIPRKCLASLCN